MSLAPDHAATLLSEIRDGGLSSRVLSWLSEATDKPVEQGAGYTGRWVCAPVDKYGEPIVPIAWPVFPSERAALFRQSTDETLTTAPAATIMYPCPTRTPTATSS